MKSNKQFYLYSEYLRLYHMIVPNFHYNDGTMWDHTRTEMRSMTLLFLQKTIVFPQNNWTILPVFLPSYAAAYWFMSMTNIISILFYRATTMVSRKCQFFEAQYEHNIAVQNTSTMNTVQLWSLFHFLEQSTHLERMVRGLKHSF